jgi:hypothetical protein
MILLHAGMLLFYAGVKLLLAYFFVSFIIIGYRYMSRKEDKLTWLVLWLVLGSYLFFHSATYRTEAPDADDEIGQWGE